MFIMTVILLNNHKTGFSKYMPLMSMALIKTYIYENSSNNAFLAFINTFFSKSEDTFGDLFE